MKILVISPKGVYAAVRLAEEARSQKIEVSVMDMYELQSCAFKVDIKGFDVLYVRNPFSNNLAKHLPEVVDLAKQFRLAGKKVVDSVIAKGILAEGKWADYQKLEAAGLPIPKTDALLNFLLSTFHFPLILKWIYGFKGKHTFLIKDQTDLDKVLERYPKEELVFQEFIPAEYEYKVITVGYKALPVILRFNIDSATKRPDFNKYLAIHTPTTSPRYAGYSSLKKEETLRSASEDSSVASPTDKEGWLAKRDGVVGADKMQTLTNLAEQSSHLLGRELSKVDILESKGKFYILEVNRFPGLDSFERLTGYNVAGEFIKYLAK